MRLTRVTFRGLTRFRDAVTIDLGSLPDGLIAIVGENGAGKTTCLESAMASLDKELPTRRGSLYGHCHGRDAFMEATWVDGTADIVTRVQIDAERRTTESSVTRNGEPITSGKAAEFGDTIDKLFGSQALRLSSVFACQDKTGNFLGMPKSERKSLFSELLNLGYLAVLAEQARTRAGQFEADLTLQRARLADIDRELDGRDQADAALLAAQSEAEAAAGRLETARLEETAAREQLARAVVAAERIAPLEQAERQARATLADADAALSQARKLTADAERTRDEKLRFIAAGNVAAMEPAARQRHADAMAGHARRRASLAAALAAVPDRDQAARTLEAATETMGMWERHAAERATLTAARDQAKRAAQVEEEQHRIALGRYDQDHARLTRQAGLVSGVPCVPNAEYQAGCPLLADARGAAAQLAALAKPADNRRESMAALIQATEALDATPEPASPEVVAKLREIADGARSDIARAIAAEGIPAQLALIDADIAATDASLARELAAAADAVMEAAAQADAVAAEYRTAEAAAQARIGEATQRAELAAREYQTASENLAVARLDMDPTALPQREVAVAAAEQCRKSGEYLTRTADAAVANAQSVVNRLAERLAERMRQSESIARTEQELGDWNLLEKSLGKDGVQALEIDAAGPEVAGLTNELLASCYGPRFSLTFETLREKRDGTYSEAFDVVVYDGAAVRRVEDLSGGERVIIGEAVSLAVAIFNSRKSGIRFETLFRDETAGALDPENALAYVQMLRRARELGGFAQVLYIAHQPEVHEAADARLVVADGAVTPERRAA